MEHLKHIKNEHTYDSKQKYDVHIITISDKVPEIEEGIWLKLNDEGQVYEWAQDFKDESDELNVHLSLVYGALSLVQKLGVGYLLNLEIREVENFLRPSNDKVVIDNVPKFLPFFEDLIQNLFKGIVYGALLKSGLVILNYTQKDYKGKLQILKNLEQKLSDECTKLFKKDVEATFIALEEEKIIFEFKGLDKNSKNFTSFLEGLRQYLCLTLSSEEIMLIAQ